MSPSLGNYLSRYIIGRLQPRSCAATTPTNEGVAVEMLLKTCDAMMRLGSPLDTRAYFTAFRYSFRGDARAPLRVS